MKLLTLTLFVFLNACTTPKITGSNPIDETIFYIGLLVGALLIGCLGK